MPIARIIYYSQNYLCSYNPWLALRVRNPFRACFTLNWDWIEPVCLSCLRINFVPLPPDVHRPFFSVLFSVLPQHPPIPQWFSSYGCISKSFWKKLGEKNVKWADSVGEHLDLTRKTNISPCLPLEWRRLVGPYTRKLIFSRSGLL